MEFIHVARLVEHDMAQAEKHRRLAE
jgi:hypothetical protein